MLSVPVAIHYIMATELRNINSLAKPNLVGDPAWTSREIAEGTYTKLLDEARISGIARKFG